MESNNKDILVEDVFVDFTLVHLEWKWSRTYKDVVPVIDQI